MTDHINYKLVIDNFQGIKHTELDLSGFVSIQGETSCGKSSIRRALAAVLFNDWEASYLNNMSDKCVIALYKYELTDGSEDDTNIEAYRATTIIKYTRTANSVKYYLKHNDKEYNFDKPGAGVPAEIQEAIGITMLDCDKETYNIHISRQQTVEPLFMIAFNEAQNTRILNRVFNVTKYEIASQLCNKDIRSYNSEIKAKQETIEDNLALIEDKKALRGSLDNQIKKLQTIYDKIQVISKYADTNLTFLNTTQQIEAINKDIDRAETAEGILAKFRAFNSYISKLKEIKATKADIESAKKGIALGLKATDISSKLEKLIDFDTLSLKAEATRTKLKSVTLNLEQSDCISVILKKLELLDTYKEIFTRVKSNRRDISEIDENLAVIETELDKIDVCPYCNSKIQHKH